MDRRTALTALTAGLSVTAANATPQSASAGKGPYGSVTDFGAVGDGTTDCTQAIQAAIDASHDCTLFFPAGTYLVSGTLNVSCSTLFDDGAVIMPSSFPGKSAVFLVRARTTHRNVCVKGRPTVDRDNGTIGIFIDGDHFGTGIAANRSKLYDCRTINLAYGIVINNFSVELHSCWSQHNGCNLSAFATSTRVEINDLRIFGGNFAEPFGPYSIKVGDLDWPSSVAAGNPHGTTGILKGFACDGGTIKVDAFSELAIENVYSEGPQAAVVNGAASACIEAGTSGQDGRCNGISIRDCYFRRADYGVYLNCAVRGLRVEGNFCSAIDKCALYCPSDAFPVLYESGAQIGSFSRAPEFHPGRRQLPAQPSRLFYTWLSRGIVAGVQRVVDHGADSILQGGQMVGLSPTAISTSYDPYGRTYAKPRADLEGELGTINAYTLSLASTTDVSSINAGDSYRTVGISSAGVVNRVNYEQGTLTLSDITGSGVVTFSQVKMAFRTDLWNSSPPATGTFAAGDRCYNSAPAPGHPKSWVCVTPGNPGTWEPEGNL